MPNLSTQQDIARGLEVLQYFHNASVEYPDYKIRSTEELNKALSSANYNFADGLGFQANMIMSTDVYDIADIRTAMQILAKDAKGKIPNRASFNSALQAVTQGNPSLIKAVGFTVTASAKDLASGAQVVGNAVIQTGASLSKIAPLLITVAVIGYVYLRVKKTA